MTVLCILFKLTDGRNIYIIKYTNLVAAEIERTPSSSTLYTTSIYIDSPYDLMHRLLVYRQWVIYFHENRKTAEKSGNIEENNSQPESLDGKTFSHVKYM